MISDVLRNCDLFVDGRGYAGKVEEMTPPKLTVQTEEYRAGGMDAPVELDMGMEKLECGFSLGAVDAGVLKLWGLRAGARVPLTFRGARAEARRGAPKSTLGYARPAQRATRDRRDRSDLAAGRRPAEDRAASARAWP